MPDWVVYEVCQDCGDRSARTQLGDLTLCDRCVGQRISVQTGWPRLPDPPPPEEIVGPDGIVHLMSYRLYRNPGGVSATAEEESPVDNGCGYEIQLLGGHDCNPSRLLAELRVKVRREIGRLNLAPHPRGAGWILENDELTGRFEWNEEEGRPYDVVVDGRTLTWEEFGNTLEPYEGWGFRLKILPLESLDEDGNRN